MFIGKRITFLGIFALLMCICKCMYVCMYVSMYDICMYNGVCLKGSNDSWTRSGQHAPQSTYLHNIAWKSPASPTQKFSRVEEVKFFTNILM